MDERSPHQTPPRATGGSLPRVLAVDDELLICRAITRAIGRHFQVTTETAASAALARFDAGERFDAVLCDLVMPDMSGITFFERLRATAPEHSARLLFLTGDIDRTGFRAAVTATRRPWVRKPFANADLVAAIRAVLEAESSAPRQRS